ncbi:PfkB family carbohydrate kinase [Desertimonas flava]|uniref:PfkB family carbohydrate kinase n=1 Tax=Desertimonas flava TaxID=2064846 RepID=UPI000E354BAD|nr:PfkB family carbohydrate kinase [Desertimonas flava]
MGDADQRLVDRLAGRPVVIVSPALLVSVTIEAGPDGGDEVHVHAAGQGYWVATMLHSLGAQPIMVTTCGGEMAGVAAAMARDEIDLRVIAAAGAGGSYIDDRRSGTRRRVAEEAPTPLDRHTVDDLLAATVAAGLESGLVVVTGSNGHETVKPSFFTALAGGLKAVGVTVVADLSGPELLATIDGGIDVLKIADNELSALDGLGGVAPDDLGGRAQALRERSGADVFVTLADAGAFALTTEGSFTGKGPTLRTVESRGAGDSFTAALAGARQAGLDVSTQFRLALAAAATNVLRHGLGSATMEAVTSLLDRVSVESGGSHRADE